MKNLLNEMYPDGIRVVSCFGGMEGLLIALTNQGVKIKSYKSFEIDKHGIALTSHNFPFVEHMGDIMDANVDDIGECDLMVLGSPCQGFSNSGKRLGLNDERSGLLIPALELMRKVKPTYWIFENVRMKTEWLELLDTIIGVKHIEIDASLVSPQSRKRCFWANFNITQPKDKGIMLKDIIEPNVDSEILYREPYYKPNGNTSGVLGYIGNKPAQATRVYSIDQKAKCLTANGGGQGGKTGLYEIKDVVLRVPEATKKGYTDIENGDCFDYTFPNSKTRRGRNMKHKSNCLETKPSFMVYEHPTVRKLTVTEAERLQGCEGWTIGDGTISNTQRLKLLGNGFCVPVIEHILCHIGNDCPPNIPQQSFDYNLQMSIT
jgi:DNA (cytosine-5)-methyltransferase 3A